MASHNFLLFIIYFFVQEKYHYPCNSKQCLWAIFPIYFCCWIRYKKGVVGRVPEVESPGSISLVGIARRLAVSRPIRRPRCRRPTYARSYSYRRPAGSFGRTATESRSAFSCSPDDPAALPKALRPAHASHMDPKTSREYTNIHTRACIHGAERTPAVRPPARPARGPPGAVDRARTPAVLTTPACARGRRYCGGICCRPCTAACRHARTHRNATRREHGRTDLSACVRVPRADLWGELGDRTSSYGAC
jgi:hypothetical protein